VAIDRDDIKIKKDSLFPPNLAEDNAEDNEGVR
jgi:hypothetical protein